MASTQPNYSNFPPFPSPPFHPFNPPPPPSHSFAPPPPPSHGPPPPRSYPFSPPPPHAHPPPSPFHPIVSPPPPAPITPPPSPNNQPIVIVIVFVSLGSLLLLSLLAFALCCSIMKSKKKKTQETDIVRVDEHKEMKETIVTGPFGQQGVVLTIEDDIHIEEEKNKNEKVGHSLHAKYNHGNSKSKKDKNQETDIIHVDEHKEIKEKIVSGPFGKQAVVLSIEDDVHIKEEIIKNDEKIGHSLHAISSDQGNSNGIDVGTSSSDQEHHHEHHQLENKP